MFVHVVAQPAPPETERLSELGLTIFDASPVAILRADSRGVLLDVNPRACKLLGCPEHELRGRHFGGFTHPEQRARDAAEHGRLMRGEVDRLHLRTRWVRRDGEPLEVDLSVTAVRDGAGRIEFLFGVAIDVTEQVRAQAALAEREAHYRAFFERNSSVMLLIHPESGQIVDANESAARFYGWDVETLRTMRITDINLLPDDVVTHELGRAWCGADDHFFFPHRLASGEVRDVEVHVSKLHQQGRLFTLSIVHDVTERSRAERDLAHSEARLRRTEEIAQVGGWDFDPERSVVVVSEGFREILGLGPREDLDREALQRFVLPEHREAFRAAWRGALLREGTFDVDVAVRTAHGEERWVKVRGSFTRGHDGGRRLVGALADITERRRVEVDRERALHEVERIARAKESFLATMSHEIRTPMNGVLGMVDALSATPLSDVQREMLETLEGSGRTLLRVIDDVLDMAKIQSGHLRIDRRPFDLGALAREVATLYRPTASGRGLALALSLDPQDELRIEGDPERLRQVLTNLVSNAIKYTHSGRVDVRIERRDEDRLHFEVADTGGGIPEEARAHLFERFMQVGPDRRGSTGLGLAISQRLVRAMGGRIEVETEVGVGSRFWFELELPKALEGALEAARAAPDGPIRPLDVLVAEDNPVNRRVVEVMLRRLGHRVTTVDDGRAALEACRERAWDVVLMDVYMPELDGIEATRRIRAHEAAAGVGPTPIVALTASALVEEQDACDLAGMTAFLSKPLSRQDLQRVLQDVARADA